MRGFSASARACSAVSRFTMSLSVTDTSAWQVDPCGPQGLLAVRLADHYPQAEPAREWQPRCVLALVDADHVHAEIVQLADYPGSHIAKARHDHVIGERALPTPDRASQPRTHDRRGNQRQEGQAI